jgi:hypothetical protein
MMSFCNGFSHSARNQTIDHFGWEAPPLGLQTYQQRYFVCDQYWQPGGPIFFYTGNEANVELCPPAVS